MRCRPIRLLSGRPDIQACEVISLLGMTGWMLALGLGRWIYPDAQYAVFVRVASEDAWLLGVCLVTCAKAWSLVLAYRPERWAWWLRRAVMVAAVGWWCFVIGTLIQTDPLWPGIGAHLGCAFASGWACYRVTLARIVRDGE